MSHISKEAHVLTVSSASEVLLPYVLSPRYAFLIHTPWIHCLIQYTHKCTSARVHTHTQKAYVPRGSSPIRKSINLNLLVLTEISNNNQHILKNKQAHGPYLSSPL